MRYVQTDWRLALSAGAAAWIGGGVLGAGLSAVHPVFGACVVPLFIVASLLALLGTRRVLTFAEDDGEWVGRCERQLAFFRLSRDRLPDGEQCQLVVWRVSPNMRYVTLLQGVLIVVGIMLSVALVGVFLIILGLTLRGRIRGSLAYRLDIKWTGSRRSFRLARVVVPDGSVRELPLEIVNILRAIKPAMPATRIAERSVTGMIW